MKNELLSKHEVAEKKGTENYLHGFDDEHVYLILDGKQYCHPNSCSSPERVLPCESWEQLDEFAVKLARKYLKAEEIQSRN